MTAPPPRRPAPPHPLLLVPVVALTLMVAACSSAPAASDTEVASLLADESVAGDAADAATIATEPASVDRSPDEAALEFSQCMRDEGLDFPDLSVDAEGNIELREAFQSVEPGSDEFRAAREACGEILAQTGFGGGRREALESPEVQDGLIAFSDCVRDAGYDVGDLTLARGGQGQGQGQGQADGQGDADQDEAADGQDGAGPEVHVTYPDGRSETGLKLRGVRVPKGTVIKTFTGGGGGFGPPAERDPERIREDLVDGYLTEEGARTLYGFDS